MKLEAYRSWAIVATIVALVFSGLFVYKMNQPGQVKTVVKQSQQAEEKQTEQPTNSSESKAQVSETDTDKAVKKNADQFIRILVEYQKNLQAKHDQLEKLSNFRVANAIAPTGPTAQMVPYKTSWEYRDVAISHKGDYDERWVLINAKFNSRSGSNIVMNDFVYKLKFVGKQVNDYWVYIKSQPQGTTNIGESIKPE